MAKKQPRKNKKISSGLCAKNLGSSERGTCSSVSESISNIFSRGTSEKSIKSILDKTSWFPYVSFAAIETYNDYIKESNDKERNCFILLFSSNNKHEQNLLLLDELLEPNYTLEFKDEENEKEYNIEVLIINDDKLGEEEFIQLLITNFYFKFPMMFVYSGKVGEFIDVISTEGFRTEP